jgi:hypothetical protein
MAGLRTETFIAIKPSPQRRKGAEETQRKPNEACQKAGGSDLSHPVDILRWRDYPPLCFLTSSVFAFLCVSFAPLRTPQGGIEKNLCGEDLVCLCG